MSKVTAILTCRNDDYGDHLLHRARMCLSSLITNFDEVVYVDWNCVDGKSIVDELKPHLPFKGNLKHVKVTKDLIKEHKPGLEKYPLIEVHGRNIGIRRATSDWVVSTNIDIVSKKPNVDGLDKKTLYAGGRRNVSINYHYRIAEYEKLEKFLYDNVDSFQAMPDANRPGDKDDPWSTVVCCGDFQLGHRDHWHSFKAFEEELIGWAFIDTNVMKKSTLVGGNVARLYHDFFHLDHAKIQKPQEGEEPLFLNDKHKSIQGFKETTNDEDWGWANLNLPVEIL